MSGSSGSRRLVGVPFFFARGYALSGVGRHGSCAQECAEGDGFDDDISSSGSTAGEITYCREGWQLEEESRSIADA